MDDPAHLTTSDILGLLARDHARTSALELAADIIACQTIVIARYQRGPLGCWTTRTSTSTATSEPARRSMRGAPANQPGAARHLAA